MPSSSRRWSRGVVAWWRKDTVATILAGMVTLWLMRWLVG